MTQKQLESECLEAFKQGNKRDAERLLPQVRQPATVRTGCYDVIVNGITIFIASKSSLLHLAAVHGWIDVIIDLITKYKCDAICRNIFKDTPLHYASEAGHLEVVRYFINEQHCDPMTKDYYHFTMQYGPQTLPNTSSTLWLVNQGRTPLHYACQYVTSTLPSTSLMNNTVTQWLKTTRARHHFTMLAIMVVPTLRNIYYPLVKWTHWLWITCRKDSNGICYSKGQLWSTETVPIFSKIKERLSRAHIHKTRPNWIQWSREDHHISTHSTLS